MDRMITARIGGVNRPLNYSVEVMFDMAEKYGNIQEALEIIQKDDRESFEAVQWFAIKMANDGELCRREAGHTPLPMVTEKDISVRLSPFAFEELRAAVVDAIGAGYRREVDGDEAERDIGLEELNAKKIEAGG